MQEDDYNPDEVWLPIPKAAAMLSASEEDIRRLIRMRRITLRESDDTVCLGDIITVLELQEFDAIMDAGGTEKQARKRAESVRARLEGAGRRQDGATLNPQLSTLNHPTTHHSPLSIHKKTKDEEGVWHDNLECLSTNQASQMLTLSIYQIYTLL